MRVHTVEPAAAACRRTAPVGARACARYLGSAWADLCALVNDVRFRGGPMSGAWSTARVSRAAGCALNVRVCARTRIIVVRADTRPVRARRVLWR